MLKETVSRQGLRRRNCSLQRLPVGLASATTAVCLSRVATLCSGGETVRHPNSMSLKGTHTLCAHANMSLHKRKRSSGQVGFRPAKVTLISSCPTQRCKPWGGWPAQADGNASTTSTSQKHRTTADAVYLRVWGDTKDPEEELWCSREPLRTAKRCVVATWTVEYVAGSLVRSILRSSSTPDGEAAND